VCLSLMNRFRLSSNIRITHIEFCWKFFLLHFIEVLCQDKLCKTDHAYLTHIMLQRQLNHLNGRKLNHRQVSHTCLLKVQHLQNWTLAQSQSYFTTGGLPPISSSWRQVPWGWWPETFF
jgi:hypothetical protein